MLSREGDAVKPLQLLRDLLEEGSDERAKVEALIEDGAIVAEEIGGAWLVELQSLSEYRDALWEVLTYED